MNFAPAARAKGALRAILHGGMWAGVLDLADAIVFFGLRGVAAERILQSIASGLMGRAAYQGGWKTAVLGLALHFTIAFGAAIVYYAASRKMAVLRNRPVLYGMLYGLAVYAFMNLVVLPLSAFPRVTYTAATMANGIAAHMFLVGLPIALAVRRYGR